MKPYDIGVIVSSKYPRYNGVIVIRAASLDKKEVMNLSRQEADFCWTDFDRISDLQVRLLPAGIELKITIE